MMRTVEEIFQILLEIAEANADLRVTVKEIRKGALCIGGGGVLGVVLGGALIATGPVGLGISGMTGAVVGACVLLGIGKKLKPVYAVLRDMTDDEKKRIVQKAKEVIREHGIDLTSEVVGRYTSSVAKKLLKLVFNLK